MYALNLTHSPEKPVFWVCADTVIVGAGETGDTIMMSGARPPGVSDSIEVDNDNEVTRQASDFTKVLGETSRIMRIVTEYDCQCNKRRSKDADARDGNRNNRTGLAEKRLTTAERRFPWLIDQERETSALCKE